MENHAKKLKASGILLSDDEREHSSSSGDSLSSKESDDGESLAIQNLKRSAKSTPVGDGSEVNESPS